MKRSALATRNDATILILEEERTKKSKLKDGYDEEATHQLQALPPPVQRFAIRPEALIRAHTPTRIERWMNPIRQRAWSLAIAFMGTMVDLSRALRRMTRRRDKAARIGRLRSAADLRAAPSIEAASTKALERGEILSLVDHPAPEGWLCVQHEGGEIGFVLADRVELE
jgi:hypothetical protein